MKSLSSSASISNFLNANDDLSDDDFSLEKCADKQANILHQGKRIEEFIKNWANNHPKDTCYRLLCILFDLFKSEVSSNISLRKDLMTHKTNERLSEEYERQLTKLFTAVKKYDPKISSLTEIFSLFQRKIKIQVPEELSNQVDQAIDEVSKLNQDFEQKRTAFEQIQNELQQIKHNFNGKIAEKTQQLQLSKEEESRLQEQLIFLQQENAELTEKAKQLQHEENPQVLKETIQHIDERMNELQSKIHIITKNHKNKVAKYKAKISQYESSVLDLRNDKATMESELDRIHQEIEVLTNPFTNVKDERKSPHIARAKFEEMKKEFEETQKRFQEEEEQNEVLNSDINGLETKLYSLNNKMKRKQKELSDLQNEFEEKENILKEIEEKRKIMKEISHRYREIDEVKNHVEMENRRLCQELENSKERYRQLAVDNNLLNKTLNDLDLKRRELALIKQQNTMKDNEVECFDHVLNSYRNIRESLELPSNMGPSQITDAVLHQLP